MLPFSGVETLVHAFMTSRLDYCNALLVDCPASSINKLQIVQNAAARVLTRSRKYDHLSQILRSLQWLPIKFRISYKILLLAYKALNGLASLTSLLARYNPLNEVELFHIWLPNSGIAFLITFGAQIHSLCKNLDERNSLAKHSFNASHNLVLQLHLIKCTLLLFSLGWTIHFYLVGTAAMLLCLYLCLGFCHRINIRW